MVKWLLVLLALAALGFAAFFALPPIVSDCSTSPLPKLGIAGLLLVLCGAAGLFAMLRGDAAQRTVLFAGLILILLGYGAALSQILPIALGHTGCPAAA